MDASEGLTAVCSVAGVGRSMQREQGSAPGPESLISIQPVQVSLKRELKCRASVATGPLLIVHHNYSRCFS